jgi:hypothetical protein
VRSLNSVVVSARLDAEARCDRLFMEAVNNGALCVSPSWIRAALIGSRDDDAQVPAKLVNKDGADWLSCQVLGFELLL